MLSRFSAELTCSMTIILFSKSPPPLRKMERYSQAVCQSADPAIDSNTIARVWNVTRKHTRKASNGKELRTISHRTIRLHTRNTDLRTSDFNLNN